MDNTNNQTNVSQRPNTFFSRNPKKKKKKRRVTRNEIISYTITVVVSLISIAVSTYYVNRYVPEDDNKVIQCTKEDGKYQKQLKQMPSVAQFMNHLRYIENKDTTKMWESVTDNKQSLWRDKLGMFYQYILTHNYEVLYIIPETDTRFHVWLRFTDNVDDSEVYLLKKFNSTKMKDLCESKIPEELVDEVFVFLEKRFKIEPEYTKDSVKSYIKYYMYNKMTIKDYVIQDWRFPVNIASDLRLQPCVQLGYYSNLQSHSMLALVEMENDTACDRWRVKTFKTEAISRW